MAERAILIVGGGTAGWLTAGYLARYFDVARNPHIRITVLESPEIGIIGVGEGTFPTIRNTLRFIGIDETRFVRETSATFKQGIRFDNWVRPPVEGRDDLSTSSTGWNSAPTSIRCATNSRTSG